MRSEANRRSYGIRVTSFIATVLGVGILFGTWIALYQWESLFTESHLAGYYCCVSEQDLPAPGTIERSLSDFFQKRPGKHLPQVILASVSISVAIFALPSQMASQESVKAPFLLACVNALYLLASVGLFLLSASIGDHVFGPKTGPYQGYDRTWYDIVLHLILWGVFFFALSRAHRWLTAKTDMDQRNPG
jgi:hypothetical protein